MKGTALGFCTPHLLATPVSNFWVTIPEPKPESLRRVYVESVASDMKTITLTAPLERGCPERAFMMQGSEP